MEKDRNRRILVRIRRSQASSRVSRSSLAEKAKENDLKEQVKEKRQLVANEAAAKEASRLKSQFLANVSGSVGPWLLWPMLIREDVP